MNDQLIRIEDKIDMINEHLTKLSVLTEINTKNLEYHILRTNILESRQTKLLWAVFFMIGVAGTNYAPELIKLINAIF